ncbi:hypothetical protein X975_11999, partial [Stegodyphus mimosarum]
MKMTAKHLNTYHHCRSSNASGTERLPRGCLSQLQKFPPSGGSLVQRNWQIPLLKEGSEGAAIAVSGAVQIMNTTRIVVTKKSISRWLKGMAWTYPETVKPKRRKRCLSTTKA